MSAKRVAELRALITVLNEIRYENKKEIKQFQRKKYKRKMSTAVIEGNDLVIEINYILELLKSYKEHYRTITELQDADHDLEVQESEIAELETELKSLKSEEISENLKEQLLTANKSLSDKYQSAKKELENLQKSKKTSVKEQQQIKQREEEFEKVLSQNEEMKRNNRSLRKQLENAQAVMSKLEQNKDSEKKIATLESRLSSSENRVKFLENRLNNQNPKENGLDIKLDGIVDICSKYLHPSHMKKVELILKDQCN